MSTDTAPLLVRADELAKMMGVSATLRRLLSAGKVPKPVRIGRSTRWRMAEVREWLRGGRLPDGNGLIVRRWPGARAASLYCTDCHYPSGAGAMANIFKVMKTLPIPRSAEIITKGGQRLVRFRRRGKQVTRPLTEDGHATAKNRPNGTSSTRTLTASGTRAGLYRQGCHAPAGR